MTHEPTEVPPFLTAFACAVCVPLVVYATYSPGARPSLPSLRHFALCLAFPLLLYVVTVSFFIAPMLLTMMSFAALAPPSQTTKMEKVQQPPFALPFNPTESAFVLCRAVLPFLCHSSGAAKNINVALRMPDGRTVARYLRDSFPELHHTAVVRDAAAAGWASLTWFTPLLKKIEMDVDDKSDEELLALLMAHSSDDMPLIRHFFFKGFNGSMYQHAPNWYKNSLKATAAALRSVDLVPFLRIPHIPDKFEDRLMDLSDSINALAVDVEEYADANELSPMFWKRLAAFEAHASGLYTAVRDGVSMTGAKSYVTKHLLNDEELRPHFDSLLEMSDGITVRLEKMNQTVSKFISRLKLQTKAPNAFEVARTSTLSKVCMIIFAIFSFTAQLIRSSVVVLSVAVLSKRAISGAKGPGTGVLHVYCAAWTGAATATAIALPQLLLLQSGILPRSNDPRSPKNLSMMLFTAVTGRAAGQAAYSSSEISKRGRVFAFIFSLAMEELVVWRCPSLLVGSTEYLEILEFMHLPSDISSIFMGISLIVAVISTLEARYADSEVHLE